MDCLGVVNTMNTDITRYVVHSDLVTQIQHSEIVLYQSKFHYFLKCTKRLTQLCNAGNKSGHILRDTSQVFSARTGCAIIWVLCWVLSAVVQLILNHVT